MICNRMTHALAALTVGLGLGLAAPAFAGDIIEDWDKVKAPEAPELKDVSVSASDTAFVIMDMQTNSCSTKARPRCVDSAKPVKAFLDKARAKGMPVVYTLTSSATVDMILPELKPQNGEPSVKSSVNKFYGTELDKILKDKGVKTVILVGTTAEGAVLATATGAAVRGYKVIVPVDGMSAAAPYAEQYTADYLVKAPGTRGKTTLTRTGMIEIK